MKRWRTALFWADLAGLAGLAGCGVDGTSARPTLSEPGRVSGAGAVDAGPCAITTLGPSPYPLGPYGVDVASTLESYAWSGRTADGALGPMTLGDVRARVPAACGRSGVLVVRIGAVWCGTCRWQASHGMALLGSDVGDRVRLFDVVVRDAENAPSAISDAATWQALEDTRTDVVIDPDFTTATLFPPRTPLPLVLVVDPRTMVIDAKLANPSEADVEQAVRVALAQIDGVPVKAAPTPTLVDGRFTSDRWDLVHDMALLDPPPTDTTNAIGDSPTAAAFGASLFGNGTLSPSGQVSCASCHEADRQYTDGSATSPGGVGHVPRNSPSLVLASYKSVQFWDGRSDSLWSQALVPIEDAKELDSSRLFVAHTIFGSLRRSYESLFGPMPPLDDLARFPSNGKPGDPAWAAMVPGDQKAVTAVFVNVGKSLAAFERTIRGTGSAIEAYAGGDMTALTDAQKDGLLAFLDTGCVSCHWGPRMTDDAFHNLRFPTGRQDNLPDRGRIDGIPLLAAGEFGAASIYSDDVSRARPLPAAGAWTLGAFKTPSLKNVALTSPYGHGGSYVQLDDVVALIGMGGLPAGSAYTVGDVDPWLPTFDPTTAASLVEFLRTLAQESAR